MRDLFYCDSVGIVGAVGIVLLCMVMGAAFMIHGWAKIQNPMGWTTVAPSTSVSVPFHKVEHVQCGTGLDTVGRSARAKAILKSVMLGPASPFAESRAGWHSPCPKGPG